MPHLRRRPKARSTIVLAGLLLGFLVSNRALQAQREPADPDEARFIEELLAKMTLEEKLGQLTQYTGRWTVTGPTVREGGDDQIKAGLVGSFLNIFGAETTRALQRIAVEESRLGIPLLFGHDVVHGFRTIFPVPLAEACSWNPDLATLSARVAAIEASAVGLHWTFAPMVDIGRDARWGRIVEGAGEDPFLGSVFAAARVRGFQGEDLGAIDTVLACAKHFAAYGGAEAGRDYNPVDISERTLWETYLPPFKAALEAGVGSFMTAFNEVAGVPATASPYLLTEVLRNQWGFDGLVVSDYTAVLELMEHGVAATAAQAGVLALQAGTDMDMVSGIYSDFLPAEAQAGRLRVEHINESVRRVLRAKYRLGLFADPYRYADSQREATHLLTDAHRAAARQVARESIVLLKNDGGVLPLDKAQGTIAVIGPLADDPEASLGSWPGAGRSDEAISVLEGIRRAVPATTEVIYARGCGVQSEDRSAFAHAVAVAEDADTVVLVLGEDETMSGEAASRTSLDLPGVQEELARAIHSTGTPTVLVLVNGRPLTIEKLDTLIPAILETWQLGSEMGPAVADVLFGDVNPSGKLVVTFPRRVGQVPIYYNHKNTGRPPDPKNKYTSKYLDVPWTPLYPFGHGLSYTTFVYRDLAVEPKTAAPGGAIRVNVTVANTGVRPGAEVVQLYLTDEVASVTRPVRELRGFQKVYLQPGEERQLSFSLQREDLAFYDAEMRRVVEPGWFTVQVGTSSAEGLTARFEVVAQEHATLSE